MFQLKMTNFLRIMHCVNHFAVIYGLIYFNPLWCLWSLFVWFLFGCLGISITFHRYLAHGSFRMYKPVRNLFVIFGCMATGGSPISWVGTHREHHAHSDRKGDPHSVTQSNWWAIYFHIWHPFIIRKKSIKDLFKDKFLIWVHRNYILIVMAYVFTLLILSLEYFVFLYALPATIAFHAYGLINTAGHSHGYRSWRTKDSSSNSWVANLLTWGEGWHNNHHNCPSSHRIGIFPLEIDFGAWVLENIPGICKNRKNLQKKGRRIREKA